MADEITRMTDYDADDITANITEVRTARGTYTTLAEHLAAIEAAIAALTPSETEEE